MGLGQRKGFKHSEESKQAISEAAKGTGKGGFNVKVKCSNCEQEMSPANLSHHYPQCLKYKGRIKEVKRLRIQLRQFGLTVEQYEVMVSEQNGLCYICHSEPTRTRLSVDHNHQTSKVRKLLCDKCNMAMGLVNESPETLQRMIDYLREHA